MLRSVPQMLKNWRIVVNRISKVRQTTCNWIKKILDEATRIVNVFLISWFFYLFLLCSLSLLVKYDFILRYEAWVNAIRGSTVQLRYIRTTHTRIIRSYFAYTRMSIRIYVYVNTRVYVLLLCIPISFFIWSIVGQTKDIWEWKGFKAKFAYC